MIADKPGLAQTIRSLVSRWRMGRDELGHEEAVRAPVSRKYLADVTDVPHPIIDSPHKWEIVGLCWRSLSGISYVTVVDLLLRRDESCRALRFHDTRELEIEKGGPTYTGGLAIDDVSRRGLEGIKVRVTDFEASPGTVQFWARSVESIPVEQFGHQENLIP